MKYIRKILVLIIVAVMLASVAIGAGVIFAVKNVNVDLISYTCEGGSEEALDMLSDIKKAVLKEVKGTLISFTDENKAAASLDGEKFYITEFEKVYPCTLNITVKERREMFAVAESDGTYTVYDDNGLVLRKAQTAEESCNKADGLPNLEVKGALDNDFKNVANICKIFADKFKSVRSLVACATLSNGLENSFTFDLRCGSKIVIYDYTVLTTEKISAVYDYFSELSGDKKIKGEIHCLVNADNEIFATYKG